MNATPLNSRLSCHSLWAKLILLFCVLGLAMWVSGFSPLPKLEADVQPQKKVEMTLQQLPEVSTQVLSAQGTLFQVKEPFLFDQSTGRADFDVIILSQKNFRGHPFLKFNSDSAALQDLVDEIKFVNAGPALAGPALDGMEKGVDSMANGLWQIVRHPEATATAFKKGGADFLKYAGKTSPSKMKRDVAALAKAYYINRCCEVAKAHSLNYFELMTDEGRRGVHFEVNLGLGSQTTVQLAALLAPFSELDWSANAAEASQVVVVTDEATDAVLTTKEFAEAGGMFPEAAAQSESAIQSGTYAGSPTQELRDLVQGEYVDPITNKVVNTNEILTEDHIVPQDTIKRMKGFDNLTLEEQSKVLNNRNNIQLLPRSLNSSKGSKSAAEWTTYMGRPLDPDYIWSSQVREKQLITELQKQIDSFLSGGGK